jgi:hypothetical protein
LKTRDLIGLIVAGAALSGCMSVPDTTPQEISLSVMPEMAKCDAYQHGTVVGSYDPSQRTIMVQRSRGSAEIFCSAAGYKDQRVSIVPDESTWGFAGKLVVDFGPIIYGRSEYPSSVQIVMQPAPA